MSVNSFQVGGDHYKSEIEHWDFIEINEIGYAEGCATKYITRSRKKNGYQDVEKAVHYVQKIKELYLAGHKKPTRNVGVITVDAFAEANKLSVKEAELIGLLVHWRHDKDLDIVLEGLHSMLMFYVPRED